MVGLAARAFIIDFYTTRFINWYWWRDSNSSVVRVFMGWVDAIVFALVAIYFINLYFSRISSSPPRLWRKPS